MNSAVGLWLHSSASASSRILMAFLITKQTHSGSAPIRSICHPWKRWRFGSFDVLTVQDGEWSRFISRSKKKKDTKGGKEICYIIWLCIKYSCKKNTNWTDENGVLCICLGWHAALVAAAGNWVVTTLFISPAGRLARLPAVFTCTHILWTAGQRHGPPFAVSLSMKRKKENTVQVCKPVLHDWTHSYGFLVRLHLPADHSDPGQSRYPSVDIRHT